MLSSTTTAHQPPRSPRATPPEIAALLDAVAGLWSRPSAYEDNGAHSGYRQVQVVAGGTLRIPAAAPLLAPFEPIHDAWLSWIDPGGFVVEHIDAGPHYERWQIPLTEAGKLIQNGTAVAHEVGVAFRVHHDDWHSVRNDDPTPRVSLVIDRAVIVSPARTPLRRR